MAFLGYAVPALAVASIAAAQSQCTVSGTQTISVAADATALSGCKTFSGSIAIATGTTDNIALEGIKVLTGDLVAVDVSQMTTLASSSIQSIGGIMDLRQNQILATLNFPVLKHVGQLNLVALPALQGYQFTTGVQTADAVLIQDTQISSLNGINPAQVSQLSLISNHFLQEVTMHLGNAANNITILDNGGSLIVNLPSLSWAASLTIANVSGFLTPSLSTVNYSMILQGNSFQRYSAPRLTVIGSAHSGGDLVMLDNSQLSNLSFPVLATIGGDLTIQNNPDLTGITGFPALSAIEGGVNMTGNFTNIVELPSLSNVAGAFTLHGPNVSAACEHFQSIRGRDSIIKGFLDCPTQDGGSLSTAISSESSSSSSTPSAGLSTGARAGIGAGAALGAIISITLVGLLFWRRKKHTRADTIEAGKPRADILEIDGTPQAELENTQAKVELDNTTARRELDNAERRIDVRHRAIAELDSTEIREPTYRSALLSDVS